MPLRIQRKRFNRRFNPRRRPKPRFSPRQMWRRKRKYSRKKARRFTNLDRFYRKQRVHASHRTYFRVSRTRGRLSVRQLQWVGSISKHLIRQSGATLRNFLYKRSSLRAGGSSLRPYSAAAPVGRLPRGGTRSPRVGAFVPVPTSSRTVRGRFVVRTWLRRASRLLHRGAGSHRRRTATYLLVRHLRSTLHLRRLIARRLRWGRRTPAVRFKRKIHRRYKRSLNGKRLQRRKKQVRRRKSQLPKKSRQHTVSRSQKLMDIRTKKQRQRRRKMRHHMRIDVSSAPTQQDLRLKKFRSKFRHPSQNASFRRKRRRAIRKNSRTVRMHLSWVHALRHLAGRRRRDPKVVRHRRRWLRRAVRRRHWRRRHHSNLPSYAYWRLVRKGSRAANVAQRRYSVRVNTLEATAAAQRSYRDARGSCRRRTVPLLRQNATYRNLTAFYTPAAFLRTRLRRLIRSRKTAPRVRGRMPRKLASRGTRLDARLQRLPFSRRVRYGAISGRVSARHLRRLPRDVRLGRARYVTQWLLGHKLQTLARGFSSSVLKLRVQRQLRIGAVRTDGAEAPMALNRSSAARLILQRRSQQRSDASMYIGGGLRSRNLLAPLGGAQVVALTRGRTAYRRRPRKATKRPRRKARRAASTYAGRFGFLNTLRRTGRTPRLTRRELHAEATVYQEQRRYLAARIRHRRPKLRLPNTTLTRRRRRKSGLSTFVQNSLKRPRTLVGRKQLYLPPVAFYDAFAKMPGIAHAIGAQTLSAYTQHGDLQPIFWIRPHNRANKKAINRVRRKRYQRARVRSAKLRLRVNIRRKVDVAVRKLRGYASRLVPSATPLGQKFKADLWVQQMGDATTPANEQVRVYGKGPSVGGLGGKLKRAVWCRRLHRTSIWRTRRRHAPLRSRMNSVVAFTAKKHAAHAARLHGLWQVRSTRAMLAIERGLSAWSPQLSARNRRKHYPRPEGLPVSRKRLTFNGRKSRRLANARRLRRRIPQRRYTNHNRARLQYFFGSVGSAGYLRFRRVHRAPSRHSRWWRPTLRPTPFAHPYSRRALTSTRYQKSAHEKARAQNIKSFNRLVRVRRDLAFHLASKARIIPWRSFRYKKPRRGVAPKTLQRWALRVRPGWTGRVAPAKATVLLARSPREIRNLHRYVSARGTYGARRWGLLDQTTLDAAGASQFSATVSLIPASVWLALHNRAGSSAAYTAVRTAVFNKFRKWIRARQRVEPIFSPRTTSIAQDALIRILRSVLRVRSTSTLRAEYHSTLRTGALDRRTRQKALQYLRLRELPNVGLDLVPSELLRRERSKAYKRWLSGVEGKLKRTQVIYTPMARSRYTENVSTIYGRHRLRFPASGRRRRSYDSLLHAFAKKVSPGRFRRVSKLRFRWARPKLSGNFHENLSTLTPMFGANRRGFAAKKLSAVAYLSPGMRELLAQRATTGSLLRRGGAGAKCRFLSLPTHKTFVSWRRALRKSAFPPKHPMYRARAGVLRRALRRRRRERVYIDLRLAVRSRRLPQERLMSFRRLRRRRSIRRLRARRRGRYSRRNARRRTKARLWSLRHLSAVGSRQGRGRPHRLPPVLPHGEDVSFTNTLRRKRTRAVRGFTVHPEPRHIRRKLRPMTPDAANRKRRRRRGRLSVRSRKRRSTRHWSERRAARLKINLRTEPRLTLAKITARKLHRGFPRRKYSSEAQPAPHARLARFASRLPAYAAPEQPRTIATQPSPSTLDRTSYLRDRGSAWLLRRRSRFSKRQMRSHRLDAGLTRQYQLEAALAEARKRAMHSLPERLVSSVTALSVTAPLWFESPVTRVVKSAATKEQEAAAAIAAKEGSFRLPAQYADGVTSLIPGLINYLLSRKIKKKNLTYAIAKHVIRNIYWSLRVYLNVDPFDGRFFVRDKVPAARVCVFEEMLEAAKQQKTLQPDRAILRHRLQPGKLIRAKSTQRFREDWLRAFFPARHALFQENPEDYGKFLLSTSRVRRLSIGPRGMVTWGTAPTSIGLEARSRQLLKLRFSPRKRRLETLLQTTRRNPVVEPAPSLYAGAVRESFFVRQFATYPGRGLALTSRWIDRQKRFVTLEEGWRTLPPAELITTRRRLIPRLEARGRTSYAATDWRTITTSLLDSRYTRTKSPRSRQYLIRLPQRFAHAPLHKKTTDIRYYKGLVTRRAPVERSRGLQWARSRRRTWSFAFKRPHTVAVLPEVRRLAALRRIQGALFSRDDARASAVAKTARSILLYRAPADRTSAATYRKSASLLYDSVGPMPLYSRLRRTAKLLSVPQKRHHDQRSGRSTRRKALKSLLPSKQAKRLGRRFKKFMTPRWRGLPKILRAYAPARRSILGQTICQRRLRRKRGYFGPTAGLFIGGSVDLAEGAAIYTRRQRQTPFDTYRPQLWNKLTLRWMKKYRIGRYWIRDATHWMRDPWLSRIVSMAPRKKASREKPKSSKATLTKDKLARKVWEFGAAERKLAAQQRRQLTRLAALHPRPSRRLAHSQYREAIQKHKEEKAKSAQQKADEERARIAEYWSRRTNKLPTEQRPRLPLKHPANFWLPHVIWKDIQRRIRRFAWRESDQVFARRGFRNAFRFTRIERRKASWLEHLIYTRATYSTRLREFRRRQFPHEQKKYKWLQRVRKQLYPGRRRRYIKRRRWHLLGNYSKKLHYSLFDMRDRSAARRHFKRLNGKSRPPISAFVTLGERLTSRLDVTCLLMKFAPTIYWARIVCTFGLLKVNGVTIYDPAYRLQPTDVIRMNRGTIDRFQHYFKPYTGWRQARRRRNTRSTAGYPRNMEYSRATGALVYKHAPDESDLRKYGRIRAVYLRWFKLDSA